MIRLCWSKVLVRQTLSICTLFLMVNTNILAREGGSEFPDTFADLVLTGGTVATVDQVMSIAEGIDFLKLKKFLNAKFLQ